MKKILLIACVGSSLFGSSQTITIDDTLSSGIGALYYVLDSNAVSLSGTTGTSANWNYSTITGYLTVPANVDTIINAADSPNSSDFPMADYNDVLNNGASSFFSNNPDSTTIHGFIIEIDAFAVLVQHNSNPLIGLKYPMTVGDTYSDVTVGQIDINGTANGGTTGTANVTVDGFGTLNVAGNIHTNITRVKLVENISASITVPFVTSGTVTRTVYSYYDFTNGVTPIFVHATINIASLLFNGGYTAVYSTDAPEYAGVKENSEIAFSVYPNPCNSITTVTTDGTADNLTVINALGQIILTITNPQVNEAIDVAKFEAGIYVVRIQKGDDVSNQKLIVE